MPPPISLISAGSLLLRVLLLHYKPRTPMGLPFTYPVLLRRIIPSDIFPRFLYASCPALPHNPTVSFPFVESLSHLLGENFQITGVPLGSNGRSSFTAVFDSPLLFRHYISKPLISFFFLSFLLSCCSCSCTRLLNSLSRYPLFPRRPSTPSARLLELLPARTSLTVSPP